MTLGKFVDLLSQTKNLNGQEWLNEFKVRVDKKQWQELKDTLLDKSLTIKFARIIGSLIAERLESIGTESLYHSTLICGHEFLREIHKKAFECKIEVEEKEIDTPLTATEMMAAAGFIKVKDNKVSLTEKGEEAAESVAREIASSKMS
ncbi:MAG: hypothetical protein WC460_01890 [Patescibacteria group bacterium]